MISRHHVVSRQIAIMIALFLPLIFIMVSIDPLNASANGNSITSSSLLGCDGGGPTAWWEANPAQAGTLPLLVAYDFDDHQVNNQFVDNTIVPPGANWMSGLITGDPPFKYIRNTYPGNRALLLNYQSPTLQDHVTVNYGETLKFTQGITIASKICFDYVLNQPAYIIASQMTDEPSGQARWRLSIDRTGVNRYALFFTIWFEGRSPVALRRDLVATDWQAGQWINVSASYDKVTGMMKVNWNQKKAQTTVSGNPLIKLREDPIRIGRGSGTSSLFVGMIDGVRIWGDKPACNTLTVGAEPGNAGEVSVTPSSGLTPFCSNSGSYATGELVQLDANPAPQSGYHFYKWKGDINFVQGSTFEDPITLMLDAPTDVLAEFLEQAEAPTLDLFPVYGPHNISVDATCNSGGCDLACGLEAQALSNDYCHEAAEDIFAATGTPVIAAQGGTLYFSCDPANAGNFVNIYDGNYTYAYSHLDRACFRDEDSTNMCGASYNPGASITCTSYFENGDTVLPGQLIGTVGRSGSASNTEPHLHFATIPNGIASCAAMNPYPFLYELEVTSCSAYVDITQFEANPVVGSAPLNVYFSWEILTPPGQDMVDCLFDPGDGSAVQVINNCAHIQQVNHIYEVEGTHSAELKAILPPPSSADDVATLDVRVAKWVEESPDSIFTSPALNANGTILYYTAMDKLIALDTTDGSLVWEFEADLNGFVISSPVVGADGTIYFATQYQIYAVNPNSSERWRFDRPNTTWGSELAIGYDGTIYVESQDDAGYGSTDCALYAIGPTTGNLIWRFQLGTIHCQASDPIVGGNGIYTWYEDDNSEQLYAISTAGTIQWTFAATGGNRTPPIINSPGQVIVMEGNKLRGIDAATGIAVWTNTFPFSTNDCASLAMAHDGTIYIVDDQGLLHSTLGSLLRWSIDINAGCSSPAIDVNGNVYIGSEDNKLYTISYGGIVLRTFMTGSIIESSVTMGGGTLYIGSTDGYLYAIASDAVLDWGNWPKYRNDTANTGQH